MYLRSNETVFIIVTSKLHIIPPSRGIQFYLTSLGKQYATILYHNIINYTELLITYYLSVPIYHT